MSSGGSAGHTGRCDDAHPDSGRRDWPAIALRETYTVMLALPADTVSGGLAVKKASPPSHRGGWDPAPGLADQVGQQLLFPFDVLGDDQHRSDGTAGWVRR